MLPKPIRDAQTSFSGGINTVADEIALQPDQFREGVNARLTEYGAATKRFGTAAWVAAPASGNALNGATWVRDSGAIVGMLVTSAGTLYTTDLTASPSPSVLAWTARTGTLSTSVVPTFAPFIELAGNDVVYIADGGPVNKYSGSTSVSELGSTAAVSVIKVHNQRLWGVGNATYPDSLFYSALNDGDSLGIGASGGGQIVVRTFSDERLVGLASYGSSLLIFHRRGVSRLTGFGQDDISVDPEGISTQTGTIAPQSIVETDNGVFFISDRGVFVASESQVAPLGNPNTPDPILPLVRTLSSSELQSVRGVLNRKEQEIWFFIPGVGVYVYHLILRAWAGPWNGDYLAMKCFWPSILGTYAESYVMMVCSDNVTVAADFDDMLGDRGTLDDPTAGTEIPLTVRLRRLYFGDDSMAKSLRFGYLTAAAPGESTIEVTWDTDFNEYGPQSILVKSGLLWDQSGLTWDASPTKYWDTDPGSRNYRVQMNGTGYYVDVTITHDDFGFPVLSRWQMDAFALGRR